MTTATTLTLIDPHNTDIRTLLRTYLKDLPIILAHHLHVSAVKARLAVRHAIDAVILGLYNHHETPTPNVSLLQAFAKPTRLDTLKKIPAEAITHDFFHRNEKDVVHTLSQATTLTASQSTITLGLVVALAKDHLGRIIEHTKLTDNEYRQWLDLQYFFVHADRLNWTIPSIPKPTNLTYNDYHTKLGKQINQKFDDSTVKLPNYRWLLELANTINTHRNYAITLGKSLSLFVSPKTTHTANKISTQFTQKKPLILLTACTLLVVLGMVAWWHIHQPKPTPTQANEPIPQDVAIVRIHDENDPKDSTQKTPNNASEK